MTNAQIVGRRTFLTLLACGTAGLAQQKDKPRDETVSKKNTREAKLRMQHLTARAVAMRGAVRSLEERLREQGLSLDPEIVANRTRMEIFMDEAEDAIKANRWDEASKAMERAESAIQKLEAVFKRK